MALCPNQDLSYKTRKKENYIFCCLIMMFMVAAHLFAELHYFNCLFFVNAQELHRNPS